MALMAAQPISPPNQPSGACPNSGCRFHAIKPVQLLAVSVVAVVVLANSRDEVTEQALVRALIKAREGASSPEARVPGRGRHLVVI
jgi:hypothetical protein